MLPALLAAGCDPCAGCAADGGGANALHAAVRAGASPDTLRALFARCGGDDRLSAALLAQDGTGGTPLLWAARAEAADMTLTALLIDAPGGRAAVNVADRGCDTPLRVATDVDCVRLLLAAGADAASRNRCSTVIGAQLARDAPAEIIVALLQGARPFSKLHDELVGSLCGLRSRADSYPPLQAERPPVRCRPRARAGGCARRWSWR